jgi:hypothetical protein
VGSGFGYNELKFQDTFPSLQYILLMVARFKIVLQSSLLVYAVFM